jgi:hypothetical protein
MKNAVLYKDIWLARNSEAYHMWDTKDFGKLDKHLKELDTKGKELMNKYPPSKTGKWYLNQVALGLV